MASGPTSLSASVPISKATVLCRIKALPAISSNSFISNDRRVPHAGSSTILFYVLPESVSILQTI
ncbi:hypothetical protein Csa_018503 [Cucumis sativus]|uniref:Uncharacterized protein n=1 Tax=Cucumis sativus TaxID=3659 RepID=A0A0A0KJ54_CUCSA|nr:hypothetical protein Csa_018503 [Cucumis sativus]